MELSLWVKTAQEACELKSQIKELEKKHELLMTYLKSSVGNKNHSEGGYWLKKEIRSGSIDYSKIEILKQVNLEDYRRPSVEYWKLENITND